MSENGYCWKCGVPILRSGKAQAKRKIDPDVWQGSWLAFHLGCEFDALVKPEDMTQSMNIASRTATKTILLALTFSAIPCQRSTIFWTKVPRSLLRCHPVSARTLLNQIAAPGEKFSFWIVLAVYKSRDGRTCLDLWENSDSPDEYYLHLA